MKKRHGLVSNSSASSFIVRFKDSPAQDRTRFSFLTPEEEIILNERGWRRTNSIMADNLRFDDYAEGSFSHINLGIDVSVNQDDIILFLLEHNISFTGSCHYGDYTVVFNKNSEFFYEFDNIGRMNEIDMSMRDKTPEDVFKENEYDQWFRKKNVQEWLNKNQWLKSDNW